MPATAPSAKSPAGTSRRPPRPRCAAARRPSGDPRRRRSTATSAGPAPIRTIVVTGGPPRRSAEHFVNYSRSLLAVTPASGCGTAALCVISAILADLRPPQDHCALRRGPGRGPDLSRPLARRHPPAAAQLVPGRSGRQRGQFARPLHAQPPFHLGHVHAAVQRVYGDDTSPSIPAVQTVAANWSGSVTDGERAALACPPRRGNGRRNPMR